MTNSSLFLTLKEGTLFSDTNLLSSMFRIVANLLIHAGFYSLLIELTVRLEHTPGTQNNPIKQKNNCANFA